MSMGATTRATGANPDTGGHLCRYPVERGRRPATGKLARLKPARAA